MRNACLMLAGLCFVSVAVPATAQINPFRSNRSQAPLSETDLDLMGNSINQLNRKPHVEVGAEESWSNPATGSYGSSKVTGIFEQAKRPCHALHHEFFPQGSTPPTTYDLKWCRISNGQWKIAS
jgi:hypothetical protein